MTLFENGVKHYTTKFENLMKGISGKSIEQMAKGHGISMDTLKAGLTSNSEDFRKFAYTYASTLMPGRVSCCTYAAVVSTIANMFGMTYKVYAGFCLQKSSPRYEKDINDWNAKKAEGNEHPFFANHVFAEVNGVEYEYFNGDTSNIDHCDVVQIAEG